MGGGAAVERERRLVWRNHVIHQTSSKSGLGSLLFWIDDTQTWRAQGKLTLNDPSSEFVCWFTRVGDFLCCLNISLDKLPQTVGLNSLRCHGSNTEMFNLSWCLQITTDIYKFYKFTSMRLERLCIMFAQRKEITSLQTSVCRISLCFLLLKL